MSDHVHAYSNWHRWGNSPLPTYRRVCVVGGCGAYEQVVADEKPADDTERQVVAWLDYCAAQLPDMTLEDAMAYVCLAFPLGRASATMMIRRWASRNKREDGRL